jgi:hypothetical protein
MRKSVPLHDHVVSPVLFLLSQPPDFLLKQSVLLLSSAVLSFALCLSSSSEFLDGKFGGLSRHNCYGDDDETKPSTTFNFICLGSVHGPIAALRAQPKRGILSGFHQVALWSGLNGLKEYSDSYLSLDYLGPVLGSKCLVT